MTKHVPPPTTINWKIASDFLEVIYGCKSPKVTFQVFDDKGCRQELASWRHGTLAECRQWITEKAAQGCGVFFTLNECDGAGRRAHNVLRAFTQASDFDTTALPTVWALEPDVIIQSSPGKFHTYWLCEPTDDLDKWCDTQARLAAYYHSDPRIIDRPRVLRLPGTWHQKKAPFQTRVELMPAPADVRTGDFARHDHISLANSHPCAYRAPGSWTAPSADRQALSELDTEDNIARADEYLLHAPLSEEGEGGNDTAFKVACQLSDLGLSVEAMLERMMVDGGWNDQCSPPWSDKELEKICRNAVRYKKNPPGAKTAEADFANAPNVDGRDRQRDQEDRDLTPEELASEEPSEYDATDLIKRPKVEQRWIVRDFVIADDATLFNGDGGVGKTTTAIQLAVSCAAHLPWLGQPLETGRAVKSMVISCEEDTDKVTMRFQAACEAAGAALVPGMCKLISYAGRDALIGTLDRQRNQIKPTKLYKKFADHIESFGAELVVIDSLYDIYGGDEINRAQVRQFTNLVRRLCRKRKIAIVVLGHPSVAGMERGTGTSGSTGWRNGFRGLIYATATQEKSGRWLHTITGKKTNYGKPGGEVDFVFDDTLQTFVHVQEVTKEKLAADAQAKFVELLDDTNKRGEGVGTTTSAPNYAPRVFAKRPDAGDFTKDDFAEAMAHLLYTTKTIAMRPYKTPRRKDRVRLEILTAESDFTEAPAE